MPVKTFCEFLLESNRLMSSGNKLRKFSKLCVLFPLTWTISGRNISRLGVYTVYSSAFEKNVVSFVLTAPLMFRLKCMIIMNSIKTTFLNLIFRIQNCHIWFYDFFLIGLYWKILSL